MMDAIYEEFEREVEEIRRRAAGDPRRELKALLFMALEREELVTTVYRESMMAKVVAQMDVSEPVKELLKYALVWIWKDEDMHTVYTRGAILNLGGFWNRIKAFGIQSSGAVGGWATAVIQHTQFRRAPISYLFARFVTWLGRRVGKVPKKVKESLKYGSFRNFALFNIQAERTAMVCWEWIADLAEANPDFSDAEVSDYRKVVFDEDRHKRIFQLLADSFDEQNRLVDGVSFDTLKEGIRSVSPYFLPRKYRELDPEEAPLGKGGKVWVLEDEGKEKQDGEGKGGVESDHAPIDRDGSPNGSVGIPNVGVEVSTRKGPGNRNTERRKLAFWRQCLEKSDLRERLEKKAQLTGKSLSELNIAIKISFTLGYHRADPSPVNDPAATEALAIYLEELGAREIKVVEVANLFDNFFENRDVHQVGEYFGFSSEHYELVNGSGDHVPYQYERGMAQYGISRTWSEADFRISFCKIRSHPLELSMLSLANIEWLGAKCEDFIFVDRKADRSTSIMMLLDAFPPHYALLDAYDQCPDGLVGMMGCKYPKTPRRFYLGADALAVDMVAARHTRLKSLPKTGIIYSANIWFGGWSEEIETIGTDEVIPNWRSPVHNRLWAALSFLSFPMYTFFSNRGSYFIPEMDTDAFPERGKAGLFTRMMRNLNRRVTGLHGIVRRNQND